MIFFFFSIAFASPAEMFLRYNIPQLAREHAEKSLRKSPDSPNAHAQMAIALCRMGKYNDALPYFAFAQGSTLYPIRIHEYHADALRYLGREMEAKQLREELLMDRAIPTGMHPRILAGMIDDLREHGKVFEAVEVAHRLMSKHPNAALSYAMMAEVYLDMGDPDEAYFYIWRGRRKTHNTRTEEVYARYLLQMGHARLAEQHIKTFFESSVRNSLLALYAQSKLQAYGPKKTLALLNRNKFKHNRSPAVLRIRMAAYQQLGKEKEYKEIESFLNRVYGSRIHKR
jgi:tetratricopeptide (TPR) repeat protein